MNVITVWPLDICGHKSKARQVSVTACFPPSHVQLHRYRHERGKCFYLGRVMVLLIEWDELREGQGT